MMTNDTTTLNGALTELGETLAENLTMKGINANAEDGLTTLANKIKDIRFDLSAAALTLTASTEEVLLNDSVELSARLVNQNNAPICGAVVLFKTDLLADPVIGHAVTNDDGVATFEYVVDAYGVYDFYAEFLGIEQCTSQLATVTCDYNLVLSADKDILSYNDSDSCTITCILDSETGLVENEEINYSIMHNETELDAGTLTTDENGEIELVYDAIGAGEVEVILSLRSLLQKTYVIKDCMFKPPLDGTDAITKWTSATNNTENGVFTSHGSFLTDGWSNNGLWQVDYDYRYTSTRYIGLLLLCDNVKITSDSRMSPSAWGGWEGQFPPQWGSYSILSAPSSFSKPSQTEWNHITIQKISENKVKLILNDTYEWIYQLNNLPNWSELHFGSKNNTMSPETGGNIQFKNIMVISL